MKKNIRLDLIKVKQGIYLKYPHLSWVGAFAHAVDKSHYEAWKEGVDFVVDLFEREFNENKIAKRECEEESKCQEI